MILLPPPEANIVSQTRKGNNIPNEVGFVLTPLRVQQAREQIRDIYPTSRFFEERKGPTGAYNCHGLTFINRRAWIVSGDAIQMILVDDQYQSLPVEQATAGDVVIYRDRDGDIEHSGVVIYRETSGSLTAPIVLSKWGMAGEYLHRFNNCPFGAGGITFWREGKND
jgi:hypothetical protein